MRLQEISPCSLTYQSEYKCIPEQFICHSIVFTQTSCLANFHLPVLYRSTFCRRFQNVNLSDNMMLSTEPAWWLCRRSIHIQGFSLSVACICGSNVYLMTSWWTTAAIQRYTQTTPKPLDHWETLAKDRQQWRQAIHRKKPH